MQTVKKKKSWTVTSYLRCYVSWDTQKRCQKSISTCNNVLWDNFKHESVKIFWSISVNLESRTNYLQRWGSNHELPPTKLSEESNDAYNPGGWAFDPHDWALVKIVFCYPEINYFLKALDICFLFIALSYNLATVQHSAYLSINLNTTPNSKRQCYAVICWKRSRRLQFPSYCRTMVQH